MLKTTLYDLLSKKYSTDQVNEMLKNTKQSSPKLPLSGVMDDLALSDLENVKPNELNVARDIAKKQMALQELDSAIKPKVNASRGVTAADWAMDPEIGRDFEKTLQENFNAENLKKNMNNPKATQALTDAYHNIKKDQRSKFILGEGSEPTKPLTRDEINRTRIKHALNRNPGDFNYKPVPLLKTAEQISSQLDNSLASEMIDHTVQETPKFKSDSPVSSIADTIDEAELNIPDSQSKIKIGARRNINPSIKNTDDLVKRAIEKIKQTGGKGSEQVKRLFHKVLPGLEGLGLGYSTYDLVKASKENWERPREDSHLRDSIKTLENMGMPIAGLLASTGNPFGLSVVAGKLAGEGADALMNYNNSLKFADPGTGNKPPLKEASEANIVPETSTTPSVLAYSQNQQEPMVHSKGGIPFNPPLGLMEPKEEVQAPEATPESPQEQLVEQQSEGVNQKSDLQKTLDLYRELASEQSTGLRGAQEKSNQNEMFANLLKSANLISSGLSGIGSGGVVGPAKINNDVLDSLVKTSDRPVTEYKQQIEDQKNDPSSRYSQMLREYYAGLQKQKLGRDLNDEEISALRDTPGSVLNTLIPLAQKDLYSDRLSKIKEMVANQKKEKELQSQEDREESRYLRAQNRLSGIVNSALRDPDVQANKKKLSAVNRIYKTFGDLDLKSEDDVNKISKDYLNKFPKLLTTEAAQELNTLLSNSNVTPSSTLGKLMPDSLVMDVAGWRDYLTNSLGPARQEQFLRLVLKMAVRQKRAAIENTKEKIAPYINANEGMKKFLKDPADLLNAASSLGLEPKDLNPELAKEMEEKMKKQGIESSTTPSQKPNIASTNTLAGKVPAGQTITLKNGKKYKVAEDGDTLIEVK